MVDQALSHIKVLDLTHYVAGPFCAKLLADYGAQVIKVERPGRGDPARSLGPFFRDHPHPEKSGLFLHLNSNKLSITLNLKSSTGALIFEELLTWADVVVENFRPGVMERLDLSYPRLSGIKPGLIMTSISNFGQSGPYRDFKATDMVEFALGGPMLFTGTREREPVKLGGRVGLCFAGQAAAIATLMALYRHDSDGSGDHIDISIMDTQAGNIDRQTALLLTYQYTGRRWSRPFTSESYLGGIYPCKDGYVDIRGRERFPSVVGMLDMPELLEDPRFATIEAREQPQNIQTLDRIVGDWLAQHTKREIWEKAQRHRVISAPMYSMADVSEDPHFRVRGLWTTADRAHVGTLEYPGRPFIMEASPWQLKRPAPLLGQHNEELFCGMLGYCPGDLVRLRQTGII
ncbi:MAG: CoA transferase [Dehalococcoidia bacterium]